MPTAKESERERGESERELEEWEASSGTGSRSASSLGHFVGSRGDFSSLAHFSATFFSLFPPAMTTF